MTLRGTVESNGYAIGGCYVTLRCSALDFFNIQGVVSLGDLPTA